MARLGFAAADGPEIEDEHHNFEALNIPPEHPARDPLDNFYINVAQTALGGAAAAAEPDVDGADSGDGTHAAADPHHLDRPRLPPRHAGCDALVHVPSDGRLMVGPDVTMADLKTVLTLFARSYLGDVETRFRPSFFPFTEPSLEFDVRWGKDWMELGGAGMVDPNVFRSVGYDPEQVTGFAFGMGLERFCMKRFEVTDIRDFFENDIRFLEQF